METTTLRNAVDRCLRATGPFASLYLPTPSLGPQAARDATLRWKNLRRDLAEAGAAEQTLAAMDDAVGVDTWAVRNRPKADPSNTAPTPPVDDEAEHAAGQALVVIAAGGDVLLRRPIPDGVGDGAARFAALPWLMPLLEAEQVQAPYLVVLLDRTGAEIWGVGREGRSIDREIDGADWPITRVAAGGWSQRRLQQRAINTWEANAAEVARDVARLAVDLGAERVLVAGEEHSVSAFRGAAPGSLAPLLHTMERGARDERGNAPQVADEVDRHVRSIEAEHTVAVIEQLRSQLPSRRAVLGAEPVLAALRLGLVDLLLVHDDAEDRRTAWFGADPTAVALDAELLRSLGTDELEQARLVDVAVRSALLLGGSVRAVPGAVLEDGVGALLRAELPDGAGER